MEQFLVRVSKLNPETLSWVVTDEQGKVIQQSQQGSVEELAKCSSGRSITALVPGTQVLLTQVKLPRISKKRALKALPFAIEDELADDVENLHFALSSHAYNGIYPVAVVGHDVMSKWFDLFEENGLRIDKMIPDYLSLPYDATFWTVVIEDQTALVRTGPLEGFVTDVSNLVPMLERKLDELEEHLPQHIYIKDYVGVEDIDIKSIVGRGVEVVVDKRTDELLTYIASNMQEEFDINLLQGKYQVRYADQKNQRIWAITAGLMGLWLLVMLGGNITQYVFFSKQDASLEKQVTELYKVVFPQAKNVVSPKVRVKRELERLKEVTVGNPFLQIIAATAPVFKKHSSLSVRGLEYQNEQATIEVDIDDFQTLEMISNAIAKQGFIVKQQEAQRVGEKVSARLLIY